MTARRHHEKFFLPALDSGCDTTSRLSPCLSVPAVMDCSQINLPALHGFSGQYFFLSNRNESRKTEEKDTHTQGGSILELSRVVHSTADHSLT